MGTQHTPQYHIDFSENDHGFSLFRGDAEQFSLGMLDDNEKKGAEQLATKLNLHDELVAEIQSEIKMLSRHIDQLWEDEGIKNSSLNSDYARKVGLLTRAKAGV